MSSNLHTWTLIHTHTSHSHTPIYTLIQMHTCTQTDGILLSDWATGHSHSSSPGLLGSFPALCQRAEINNSRGERSTLAHSFGLSACGKAAHHGGSTWQRKLLISWCPGSKERDRKGLHYPLQGYIYNDLLTSTWPKLLKVPLPWNRATGWGLITFWCDIWDLNSSTRQKHVWIYM